MTAERTGPTDGAHADAAPGKSDDRQAFLRRLNETFRPLAEPDRILAEACRLLGTHLRVNRVAYARISGDTCVIADNYVDGVPSMAGSFRVSDLVAELTDDVITRGCLITTDTSADPRTAPVREALEAAGIGAYLCPLTRTGVE